MVKINEYMFSKNYFPRKKKIEPISKSQFRKNELGYNQRRLSIEKRKGIRRKIINAGLGLLALLYVKGCSLEFRNPFTDRLLRTNIEKVTQQNDLELNIKMQEAYPVETYFDYTARMTNVSNRNLIFNNLEKDCLEMKILDEHNNLAWKNYTTNSPFIIELYADGGYFEQETKRDTNIMRISGAKVDLSRSDWFGKVKTKIPKLVIVEYWDIMQTDNKIPSYLGGIYYINIKIKYSKNDTLRMAEFNSPEFLVPYTPNADTTNIPSSTLFRFKYAWFRNHYY